MRTHTHGVSDYQTVPAYCSIHSSFFAPPDVHTCAYPLPKKESVCLVLPFCGVALFSIKVRSVQLPFLLRAGTNLHRGEIRLC